MVGMATGDLDGHLGVVAPAGRIIVRVEVRLVAACHLVHLVRDRGFHALRAPERIKAAVAHLARRGRVGRDVRRANNAVVLGMGVSVPGGGLIDAIRIVARGGT